MHLICLLTYYYMYLTCKILKKCMPAKLLVMQNWAKTAHLPQTTTGISFGNFIYTTIVCNGTPYYELYKISSLEAHFIYECFFIWFLTLFYIFYCISFFIYNIYTGLYLFIIILTLFLVYFCLSVCIGWSFYAMPHF